MKAFNILASAFLFVVSALSQEQYTIQPSSVPLSTRQQWCTSEKAQCPLICLQVGNQYEETRHNDCDPFQLTYLCVCQNGVIPNVSRYSLTLPYFICSEWGTQCVANCGEDSQCASSCRQDHPCGAQDSSPPNKTVIAASKSAAAAASTKTKAGAVHTGFADGTPAGGAGNIRPPVLLGMSGNGSLMLVLGALFLGFAVGL